MAPQSMPPAAVFGKLNVGVGAASNAAFSVSAGPVPVGVATDGAAAGVFGVSSDAFDVSAGARGVTAGDVAAGATCDPACVGIAALAPGVTGIGSVAPAGWVFF